MMEHAKYGEIYFFSCDVAVVVVLRVVLRVEISDASFVSWVFNKVVIEDETPLDEDEEDIGDVDNVDNNSVTGEIEVEVAHTVDVDSSGVNEDGEDVIINEDWSEVSVDERTTPVKGTGIDRFTVDGVSGNGEDELLVDDNTDV